VDVPIPLVGRIGIDRRRDKSLGIPKTPHLFSRRRVTDRNRVGVTRENASLAARKLALAGEARRERDGQIGERREHSHLKSTASKKLSESSANRRGNNVVALILLRVEIVISRLMPDASEVRVADGVAAEDLSLTRTGADTEGITHTGLDHIGQRGGHTANNLPA